MIHNKQALYIIRCEVYISRISDNDKAMAIHIRPKCTDQERAFKFLTSFWTTQYFADFLVPLSGLSYTKKVLVKNRTQKKAGKKA